MTQLILAAKACSQCLTSKARIVPGERAAQIIRDCRRSGNHFVCHKSEDGEVVHCRGVHDLHESNAYRFATRLGIPIIEKDMDQ